MFVSTTRMLTVQRNSLSSERFLVCLFLINVSSKGEIQRDTKLSQDPVAVLLIYGV